MEVFELRDQVTTDYSAYMRSFIEIRDPRVAKLVDDRPNAAKILLDKLGWPAKVQGVSSDDDDATPLKVEIAGETVEAPNVPSLFTPWLHEIAWARRKKTRKYAPQGCLRGAFQLSAQPDQEGTSLISSMSWWSVRGRLGGSWCGRSTGRRRSLA